MSRAIAKYEGYPVLSYEPAKEKTSGGSRAQLRRALLRDIRVCYWCGIECKEYTVQKGEKYPDDMATIDHLVSRFHRKRGEVVPKVLACNRCNIERGRVEAKKFPPNPPRKKLSTPIP